VNFCGWTNRSRRNGEETPAKIGLREQHWLAAQPQHVCQSVSSNHGVGAVFFI